jgi:enoyl-CoA hydratase/carnithine racemase
VKLNDGQAGFAVGWISGLLVTGLLACTSAQVATAQQDFHAASAAALGLITAAQQNPELVAEAKAAIVTMVTKAAPQDAPVFASALAHIDNNNLAAAAAIVSVGVQASAPAGSVSK